MHAYVRIHVHCTYTHIHRPTRITCMYIHHTFIINTHLFKYTHMHARKHTYIHVYIHKFIHNYVHAYTCIHIYTHMHMYTCIYIHAYIRTYIYTYIYHACINTYILGWSLFQNSCEMIRAPPKVFQIG